MLFISYTIASNSVTPKVVPEALCFQMVRPSCFLVNAIFQELIEIEGSNLIKVCIT